MAKHWRKANRQVLRAAEKAHAILNESYSDSVSETVNDFIVSSLASLAKLQEMVIREEGPSKTRLELPKLSFISFMGKATAIIRRFDPTLLGHGLNFKKRLGGDYAIIAKRSFNPVGHAEFNRDWNKRWSNAARALEAVQTEFGGEFSKVVQTNSGGYILSEYELVVKGDR